MLGKLRKFYIFTTKPKLDDLMCDGRKWIKQKGDVL